MRIVNPPVTAGQKLVMVIGAGFGGLNVALQLADRKDLEVVVIDQKNHHLFQPLLYQVATGGLNPADIAAPIRSQFSDAENVRVHLARVKAINLKEKWIQSDEDIQVSYDYLVIACGARHSYFAHPEWEDFAPGLKTVEQATEIRRRILSAFEHAENELDPEIQRSLLNFVIVGGGPTGVELAGAIADISRTVLQKDFRRIDSTKTQVILVEGSERILAMFDPKLSARAQADLEKLGVKVRTDCRVSGIDADGVLIGDERIAAKTVLWAAGVQADKISKDLGVELDRSGRIVVNTDLSIPGFPEAFAIGDIAHFPLANGHSLPGLAPVAIQQGRRVAKNIIATILAEPRKEFRYLDKGQMATIGKGRAIAQTAGLRFGGYLAWLAWLLVHLLFLVGFRNKIAVFVDWTWNYLFSRRGSRLITDKNWKL